MILLRRNAGNSLHIVKFRLCKSAEKNCSEAGSYYSGLACRFPTGGRASPALYGSAPHAALAAPAFVCPCLCACARIGAARGTCRSRARQGGDMSLPPSRKGRRRVLHEASCFANTSYTTVRKNTTIFVFCEHFKPLPQAGTGRGKPGSGADAGEDRRAFREAVT